MSGLAECRSRGDLADAGAHARGFDADVSGQAVRGVRSARPLPLGVYDQEARPVDGVA